MLVMKTLKYKSMRVDKGSEVDYKDIAIIAELRANARMPVREIAGRVGLHPNTVFQRIARLEDIGIIKGYRAELDFDRLGYPYCAIVMMKASDDYLNASFEDMKKKLDIPEIQTFYNITGDNDWCAIVRARSQGDFARILNEILSRGAVRTTSYIVLNVEKRPLAFNPLFRTELE